jgi:hypothetical protein
MGKDRINKIRCEKEGGVCRRGGGVRRRERASEWMQSAVCERDNVRGYRLSVPVCVSGAKRPVRCDEMYGVGRGQ